MISSLLTVKFFVPQPRPALVDRPLLAARFARGLDRPLTLISAPAGFGKSTLVSSWFSSQTVDSLADPRFDTLAWLSLDTNDNHPPQFWAYLIASLQAGFAAVRAARPAKNKPLFNHPLELLLADPPAPIQPVLDTLINEIAQCGARILLALDDYHLIQDSQIHEQFTYLLEHQPENLRLVVSTRVDPPLPIARLRARGQLSEFRANDLRMNAGEAAGFMHEMLGLELSAEEIQAIENSTEGWAAGLQMAALALQAVVIDQPRDDPGSLQRNIKNFIASFSGVHMYILDYLADEVFNRQPPEVQEFLLKTSILERMDAGLCAAVLQPDDEAQEMRDPNRAGAVLETLEKSNLFLIRLDNQRKWFRYHHLFADLLRVRLEQAWPEAIPGLHLRASRGYERSGMIAESVHHALVAQNWEWAASLLEKHVTAYLEKGQLSTVLQWIDQLPEAVLRSRPLLCTQVAWALAHAGRFQRVPPLIAMIETALAAWDEQKTSALPRSLLEPDQVRVRATLAILRAFGLIMAAKPEQALEHAKNALDNLSRLEPRELAWLNWVCGYAYRGMGKLDQAIHFFEIAIEISRKANTIWEDMSTDLGIAYRFNGKLDSAARVLRDALRRAEELGLRNKGNLSRVEAFLSAVLLEQNRLDEALEHAQQGVYYLQWWPSHNHITTAYVYLGLALLGRGRLDEAAEALQTAAQEQYKGQVMPTVNRLVEYASIRLWLRCGKWDLLDRWLAAQQVDLPDLSSASRLFNEYEDMRLVILARVWIGKGRQEANPMWFERAFALLSQVEGLAERSRWVQAQVEIHLLQAIALHELGRNGDGLRCLTRSLALGMPAGYVQMYLQEGPTLAEMLQAWLRLSMPQAAPPELSPQRVKALVDLFEQSLPPQLDNRPGLVEALTEREREVLQLLALGLSNKEMAQRLVVSEGTVKTHVHNLIGKLGAQSRTHVLARAKELRLL